MGLLLPAWSSLRPFLPETVMVLTICVVLLIPVISPRKNNLAVGIAAALGLGLALLALFGLDSHGAMAINPQASSAGGAYLNALLIMDPFAWFFKLSVLLFALLVVGLWAFTTRETMGPGDGPEFFVLLLTATTGMCLMGSTGHLLMMFLAVEMASLPSYVLAGFRKTRRLGAEAALKYVLFGAVSAAVMLYGMSLLYGLCGSLQLSVIAEKAAALPGPREQFVLVLGIVGLLVGIGFKIAMVPVHFWAPDVFEGTNIDVAAFLSVASKAGGLALLMRVLVSLSPLYHQPAGSVSLRWVGVAVLALGAISAFWANLAAFAQNNIKRLLAYSSIAHAGYMLLAMAVVIGPEKMSLSEAEPFASLAIEGLLFYLFMYLFINAGVFIAAAAIAQRIGSEDIRDYAGLGRRSPILAACMVVFVFSLVGIPMTIGFGAKLKLFQVLYDSHHWIGYIGLLVLAINTVLAAFYYFRIIKQMYLVPSTAPAVSELTPTTLLAGLLVLPNIVLFLAYGWVDDQARTFSKVYRMENTTQVVQPGPAPSARLPGQG